MTLYEWSPEFKEMKSESDFISTKADKLFLRSEKAFSLVDLTTKNPLEQERIRAARKAVGLAHRNITSHLVKALNLDRHDYPLEKRRKNIRLAEKGLGTIEQAVVEFEALLEQEFLPLSLF